MVAHKVKLILFWIEFGHRDHNFFNHLAIVFEKVTCTQAIVFFQFQKSFQLWVRWRFGLGRWHLCNSYFFWNFLIGRVKSQTRYFIINEKLRIICLTFLLGFRFSTTLVWLFKLWRRPGVGICFFKIFERTFSHGVF